MEFNWQNILFPIFGGVTLALGFLLITFIMWLFLKKLGLIRGSFIESWLRWDRRSQLLSHRLLLLLLAVVILALFVVWDSR